jgi:arylsulfatase
LLPWLKCQTTAPIDRIDVSFLVGKGPTTGRDHYILSFGIDGELMSVKCRYYKMVLRYTPGPALEAMTHDS